MHGNVGGDRLVAHRVQHGVAGAVRYIACAPFLRAAKIARGDQPVRLVRLKDGLLAPVHGDLVCAALYPVPRHAPGGQFPYGLRRGVGEHAHHLLVRAPVAAAHGVGEVAVLIVAGRAGAIAEAGLHAALGRRGVRALGRHQAEDDRVVAASLHADSRALAGQSAADHQYVGVDNLHGLVTIPGRKAAAGMYGSPAWSACW